jgi:hypothetical protein
MVLLSELTSRAVSFLEKLSSERIKRLTREEFAEALRVDLRDPLKGQDEDC